MGMKEFAMRNKIPLLQGLGIAALFLLGFLMLQAGTRYSPPQYDANLSEGGSGANAPGGASGETGYGSGFGAGAGTDSGSGQAGPNCTPLDNSSVKLSFAYFITSFTPEGQSAMHLSRSHIGEEEILGIKADIYEMRINASLAGMSFDQLSREWLNPKTGACIKAEAKSAGGFLPIGCDRVMSGSPVPSCREQLFGYNITGNESVSVPAGNFIAGRYETGKETIWVAPGVPVPVKFVSTEGGAQVIGELVSYGGG